MRSRSLNLIVAIAIAGSALYLALSVALTTTPPTAGAPTAAPDSATPAAPTTSPVPGVPTQPPLLLSPIPSQTVRIPVLLYHFIRVNPVASDRLGFALSVTPPDLDAQLSELQRARIRTLSPNEFFDIVHSGRQPLTPVVLLTFDDGFDDFATAAAPLLRARNMTGIDYVVSGFVGRHQYMTLDQLRAVERLGMHVGAHSIHHVPLATLSAAGASAEITGCRAALQTMLGHSITDFAYPFGSFNKPVEQMVAAAGFRTGATTIDRSQQQVGEPFAIGRHEVVGGTTLAGFDAMMGITPRAPLQRHARQLVPPVPGGDIAVPSQRQRRRSR